jgi:hypothetical protein
MKVFNIPIKEFDEVGGDDCGGPKAERGDTFLPKALPAMLSMDSDPGDRWLSVPEPGLWSGSR